MMQAVLTRPRIATRSALGRAALVVALLGLGWGAAFGAGVLYGRMSGVTPAPAASSAVTAGNTGAAVPAAPVRPAAPAGGGDGGGH